jgi:hypothetical protein
MIDPKYCIIIDQKSVTVDGKIATHYRNAPIKGVELLPKSFQDVQEHLRIKFDRAPLRMKVLSSDTPGRYRQIFNYDPSPKHGKFFYTQLIFEDGITKWGCCGQFGTEYAVPNSKFPEYEIGCAAGCAYSACSMGMIGLIDALVADIYPQKSLINQKRPNPNSTNNIEQTDAQPGMDIIDLEQFKNLSDNDRLQFLRQIANMTMTKGDQ